MYANSYTLKSLTGLVTNTYILSIVVAIVFIGISILFANMVAWEGGKTPNDARKRKVWFYFLGILATISFFLWNFLYVASLVKGAPAQSKFLMHNGISTALVLVLYIIIGFALSKLLKKRKYGTIF